MQRILNAFMDEIARQGFEPLLMPQTARTTQVRIELYFTGIDPAGESGDDNHNTAYERISFSAQVRSDGTHELWLTDTIISIRKLLSYRTDRMSFSVDAGDGKSYTMYAAWERQSTGQFDYHEDEESEGMPVSYYEPWRVTIAYPASLIKR
jgi:hypothetical protein